MEKPTQIFADKIHEKITELAGRADTLSSEQRAVMNCLLQTHKQTQGEKFITQTDIAKSERWLGCHPEHEIDIVKNEFETTNRMVREIIRQLRVKFYVPIISTSKGYKIAFKEEEARAYLETIEAKIKAQSKSLFETYRAMQVALNIESKLEI